MFLYPEVNKLDANLFNSLDETGSTIFLPVLLQPELMTNARSKRTEGNVTPLTGEKSPEEKETEERDSKARNPNRSFAGLQYWTLRRHNFHSRTTD